MGAALASAFIDPKDLPGCVPALGEEADCSFGNEGWGWGLIQVFSLMTTYGVILYNASNMLSSGSELLLLVPSIAGIVGSVVRTGTGQLLYSGPASPVRTHCHCHIYDISPCMHTSVYKHIHTYLLTYLLT